MTVIHRPHACGLPGRPDRRGILFRCGCGRLWRSAYPGNPYYAHWRRAGPLYRLLFRKRIAETRIRASA